MHVPPRQVPLRRPALERFRRGGRRQEPARRRSSGTSPVSHDASGQVPPLVGFFRRHRALVVLWVLTAMLSPLPVGNTLLAKTAVDDAVDGTTARMPWLIAALGGVALMTFVTDALRRHTADRLSLHAQHDVRTAVLRSVHRRDGRGLDALRTGQVMSLTSNDLQLVQELTTKSLQSLGPLLFALTALAAMLWLSPLLTVISLVITPATVIVAQRSRATLLPATSAAQQSAANVTQHIDETLAGIRVVKGFGQEQRETRRLTALARYLFAERMNVARLAARPAAVLSSMPLLGQVAVLSFGGWLALRGHISTGTFLAFNGYVASLIGPARLLSDTLLSAQSTRASVIRLRALIDARPAVTDRVDATDLPDGPLEVRFDDVTFSHTSEGESTLHDVSFAVQPGEVLVVTGSSGAGKSTLCSLIARFYDADQGAVRIGPPGAATDVRDLSLRSLRAAVGIAFEEPFLFSGSVRDNIACGRPDIPDSELRAAARAAGVEEFVAALPHGYDTLLGDDGLTLSGGQRQRIALARAIAARPRVMVLDNATSAVDRLTEAEIDKALAALAPTCTTIVVSRSPDWLEQADHIVVLDGGKVADAGGHAELLARSALFRSLAGRSPETGEPDSTGTAQVPAPTALWPGETVHDAEPPRYGRRETGTGTTHEQGQAHDSDPVLPDPSRHYRLTEAIPLVRRALAAAVLLATAEMLIAMAFPQLVRKGIDNAVAVGETRPLLWVSLLSILMIAAGWIVSLRRAVTTARVGETFLFSLRTGVYSHLQQLGMDFHERELVGRMLTTATADIDAQSRFVQSGFSTSLASVLTVLGIIVALVVTDPWLSLCALASLPLVAVSTWLFGRRVGRASHEARERLGQLNAGLRENVRGARTIQACASEEQMWDDFARHSDDYRRNRLRAQTYIAGYFPFVNLLSHTVNASIIVLGAYRIQSHSLSVGTFMAMWLYSRLLFDPIQQLARVFDTYQQARVGLSRIRQLLAIDGGGQEDSDPSAELSVSRGEIELRNVTFQYPGGDRPALRDISLTVQPGTTLAVVGRSGSGKSTLIKLIARFHDPTEGLVLMDGIDVRRYRTAGFRRYVGIVPQEAHLFSRSIADNIRYGRPDASRDEVETAARSVGALDAIAAQPGGFAHVLGERSQGLSAGQRQLLSLARVELVDPRVLLIDEGTSALDPATEERVLAAHQRLADSRTTITVTHRITTAARADRIAVLDDGRLVEHGTHAELMAAQGRYAQMYGADAAEPGFHASGKDDGTRDYG